VLFSYALASSIALALACAQREPTAADQSSAAKTPAQSSVAKVPEEWRTVTLGPVTAEMPAKNIAPGPTVLPESAQSIDSVYSIDDRKVVYQVILTHRLFSYDSPIIALSDDPQTYWIEKLYGDGRANGETIEETFRGSYADDRNARMGKASDGAHMERYLYFRQGDDFITVRARAPKNDFEGVQASMDRFFRSVRVLRQP
jgi:hypothetical protein